ncbi:class I SAM-dependent methyltransferase, partial [Campylobacter jejuni]|nr:class I SAM-dependent methyltransferase [Campylobacter jejuni]
SQCDKCGYIENLAFNKNEMQKMYSSAGYYQTKNFTSRLNKHIIEIKNTIMKYAKNTDIFLEIAPGRGDLALALSREVSFIYTIDPSKSSSNYDKTKNMKHIQGFFSKKFLDEQVDNKINFIVFRHLLEHIDNPKNFLKDIVEYLDENGMIYLEVPNAHDILRYKRFIDIYHDHCGYYQEATLVNIMNHLGCKLIEKVKYFDEQHIGLFFLKKQIRKYQEPFVFYNNIKDSFDIEIKYINDVLSRYKNIGIYGAGVQGHTLINHLNYKNLLKIVCAFEINRDKVGKYMVNSNILINYPDRKSLEKLDCLIMAIPSHEVYAYENEILDFIRKKYFQGDVIRTAKGIECFKFSKGK